MVLNNHKLTPAQRRMVDAIAMGHDEGLHPGPLSALLKHRIVEEYRVDVGAYQVRRYRLPAWVHYEWAQQSAEEDAI